MTMKEDIMVACGIVLLCGLITTILSGLYGNPGMMGAGLSMASLGCIGMVLSVLLGGVNP